MCQTTTEKMKNDQSKLRMRRGLVECNEAKAGNDLAGNHAKFSLSLLILRGRKIYTTTSEIFVFSFFGMDFCFAAARALRLSPYAPHLRVYAFLST